MPSGARAYAYVRMRGCKSRLLTRTGALPLFTAADPGAMQRVLTTLELTDPMQRLLRVYARAIRGYPRGAPLFRALLRLHEIENVKLLWRAAAKPQTHGRVREAWLDLGALASFAIADAASARELADFFAPTPYAAVTANVSRAHGSDLAAAELAFDRWASQRLLDEAHALPRRETLARRLVATIVRERDAEIVRRGAKWYGLTSVTASAADVVSMRAERLRLCRRAFAGDPFLIAPALAVIVLAEEEVRAVRALAERCGDASLDAPLLRALAGSQIGET
jgi:vacuolar-type H+-ATPase subunit C/Vma6